MIVVIGIGDSVDKTYSTLNPSRKIVGPRVDGGV